jgi:hypothetical protein
MEPRFYVGCVGIKPPDFTTEFTLAKDARASFVVPFNKRFNTDHVQKINNAAFSVSIGTDVNTAV